jgi:ferritin-like metal-binding protein YciE
MVLAGAAAGGEREDEAAGREPGDAHDSIVAEACSQTVRRGSGRCNDNERGRTMATEISDQLTKYLADAHSIEEQALAQLKSAPDIAGDEQLAQAFRAHEQETERHEQLVRNLLEARGESPSSVKDTVMKLGGKGFVLFARAQPDTPGKLLAHALSYEALEVASYELLGRVAKQAGEEHVQQAAVEIVRDERAMMERLEGGYDRAVDASMKAVGRDDLQEQLRKYLADAHAIEEQAAKFLERAVSLTEGTPLGKLFDEHLDETRMHSELIEQRLDALGGDPSSLKDALMRMGALNWAEFFHAHPNTPGKLAAFAYAFEHLEIGGYEQLKRVAQRAGDTETVAAVERILGEERAAAEKIAGSFDQAATLALEAQGVKR